MPNCSASCPSPLQAIRVFCQEIKLEHTLLVVKQFQRGSVHTLLIQRGSNGFEVLKYVFDVIILVEDFQTCCRGAMSGIMGIGYTCISISQCHYRLLNMSSASYFRYTCTLFYFSMMSYNIKMRRRVTLCIQPFHLETQHYFANITMTSAFILWIFRRLERHSFLPAREDKIMINRLFLCRCSRHISFSRMN